jgi:5'-nucleotidase
MLRVAVSTRALFNLEDGHRIYESEGAEAFDAYMRKHESKPLRPGDAFDIVRKLLALNTVDQPELVDVILLSSNSLDAGARVMNSVRHYGLAIDRAVFTSGGDRFRIAKAANVTLFLSTNPGEVRKALEYGIAAATITPNPARNPARGQSSTLCIAFDGDSVLFDDSAERVNQLEGLAAFTASEQSKARLPLGEGPFKPVLQGLHDIQTCIADNADVKLLVALVTARGVSAYERVVKTFRSWGLRVDQSFFCSGMPKGPLLDALGADLFIDDSAKNVESAAQYVLAGHVPIGVLGTKGAPTDPVTA